MEVIVYFAISCGFEGAGCGFWKSFFWPATVGRIIVDEARKRGFLEPSP